MPTSMFIAQIIQRQATTLQRPSPTRQRNQPPQEHAKQPADYQTFRTAVLSNDSVKHQTHETPRRTWATNTTVGTERRKQRPFVGVGARASDGPLPIGRRGRNLLLCRLRLVFERRLRIRSLGGEREGRLIYCALLKSKVILTSQTIKTVIETKKTTFTMRDSFSSSETQLNFENTLVVRVRVMQQAN